MPDLFKLEIEGFDQLDRIAGRLEDASVLEKVLDEGTAIIFNRIRTRFLQAVDPQGVPWIVSQAAKDREAKGKGGLTGYDTGDLFHSLQLFKSRPDERQIGTDVEYAPFFQFSPPKAAHQRIFLDFTQEDRDMMGGLVALRIQEALNGR